jgi:hypothetical protein
VKISTAASLVKIEPVTAPSAKMRAKSLRASPRAPCAMRRASHRNTPASSATSVMIIRLTSVTTGAARISSDHRRRRWLTRPVATHRSAPSAAATAWSIVSCPKRGRRSESPTVKARIETAATSTKGAGLLGLRWRQESPRLAGRRARARG